MKSGQRCTFCERRATEWHHIAGRNQCSWFGTPLCAEHHQRITSAYYNANPDMMKPASDLEQRKQRAREGCLVFLWLLNHPEEVNPERILR